MANVFTYALCNEMNFENYLAQTYGEAYKRKTTFVNDLSIADYISGSAGVKDTYRNVVNSWLANEGYFTEFIMSLNFMSWLHHERGNSDLSTTYADLYYNALDKAYESFSEEAKTRLYQLID